MGLEILLGFYLGKRKGDSIWTMMEGKTFYY
jgi:hypothetical protein